MALDFVSSWGVSEKNLAFLDQFVMLNGRPPVVLAIGNIANNALKNALILRKRGIECDVLCYDYYHVMGCPEWECADFPTQGINFDAPQWSTIDLKGYERPRWFVQGRLSACLDYLLAMREGRPDAEKLWRRLSDEVDDSKSVFQLEANSVPDHEVKLGLARLKFLFGSYFPNRASAFDDDDLATRYGNHFQLAPKWRALLEKYDCIIGYSTDGFFPLAFQKHPYISFEHGTIRTFPFEETTLGRLCALTYVHASDTLLTNCDNIVAAQRLKLRSYRFVPHPIVEVKPGEAAKKLRQELIRNHDTDFIVFHPSRQHWSSDRNLNWEKGNDFLIEGFARFVKLFRPKALLVMVDWGQTVSQSKALISRLGISDRVLWIEPLTVPGVGRYIAASDALADQFVIGAWGAIMPHGLMLGVPTLIHLNEEVHRWCFPEMPPILNVRTADEIAAALARLTEPAVSKWYRQAGPEWYRRYHSEDVVAGRLLDSLSHCLKVDSLYDPIRKMSELEATLMARLELSPTVNSTNKSRQNSRKFAQRISIYLQQLRLRCPVVGGFLYAAARALYRTSKVLAQKLCIR